MKFAMEYLVYILPVVLAVVTTDGAEWLQKVSTLFNGLKPGVKRLVVATGSFLLTKAAAAGIALTTTDPTMLANSDLMALLSAGLSFIFHLGNQAKAVRAAVAPTTEYDPRA